MILLLFGQSLIGVTINIRSEILMANSDDKYNSNNALVQKSRPLFSLWKEKEKINLFEYKMLDKYLSKINNSDLFVFCKNCGSIIYKKSEKTYINSIKPSSYQNKTEMDPLELFPTYINTPFTKKYYN